MNVAQVSYIDFELLKANVRYMGQNPETFLGIAFYYDRYGSLGKIGKLPKGVSTRGKIIVTIYDTRNRFTYKTGMILLDEFKRTLKVIYSYIQVTATDLTNDLYAELVTAERIHLAYFYQGEYHLWNE